MMWRLRCGQMDTQALHPGYLGSTAVRATPLPSLIVDSDQWVSGRELRLMVRECCEAWMALPLARVLHPRSLGPLHGADASGD